MTRYRNGTGILFAIGVLALAAPAPADDAEGEKRGSHRTGWIEKYDADGDGKLSDAEMEAAKAAHQGRKDRRLERWDTDGDGELSDAERDAAKAEWKQKRSDLLAKYDADGDGKLSPEEREKARADGAPGGFGWGRREPQGRGRPGPRGAPGPPSEVAPE